MRPEYHFRAMNTDVSVALEDNAIAGVSDALHAVRELFEQTERVCSRFLEESELSELNRSAGQIVSVSPLMYKALQAAADAFAETGGLFNPGVLPQLERAGYNRSMEKLQGGASPLPASAAAPVPSLLPYELLDAKTHRVQLQEGAKLDLGGIVKGWTVDRAAEFLKSCGAGIVNAGGDLRIFGDLHEPWTVGVSDPFAPDNILSEIALRRGAIATSSTQKRRWKQGDDWMHHLIDPATGRPSESRIVSASVTAPTCVQADVWAKATLLLGEQDGRTFLKKRNAHALLVDDQRDVRRF